MIKQIFMDIIGFLKWAQLNQSDVNEIVYEQDCPVFLSPDVNSLHIMWVEPDGQISHEIADYNGFDTVLEMLEDEICDDRQGPVEAGSIYEAMSDFTEWTPDNTPVITLAQLGVTL